MTVTALPRPLLSRDLDRTIDFELPDELIATAPIESTGEPRERTRLLVARRFEGTIDDDATAADLPRILEPGDVLVVNTSRTLPAAVPANDRRLLHLSTELPGGLWTVELRTVCNAGSRPYLEGRPGEIVMLRGGGRAELLAPYPLDSDAPARLWVAALSLPTPLLEYLEVHGQPIRYGCDDNVWPLDAYQTVFGVEPGSVEMPSASRAFTPRLVADLVNAGIGFAPVLLHTGVSSLEAHEPPYAERYRVSSAAAERVNAARANEHRVIAVGTTATRAIETVADAHGWAHPGEGWTELVITPTRGVRTIDGVLSGWHEPNASHLALMEAVAGRRLLERSYAAAIERGYRWHEFGDLHLVVP